MSEPYAGSAGKYSADNAVSPRGAYAGSFTIAVATGDVVFSLGFYRRVCVPDSGTAASDKCVHELARPINSYR